MNQVDFHGEALRTAESDYAELLARCPVGHSDKYGGFDYLARYRDVHDAEQKLDTFSVRPSMLLPSVSKKPIVVIDSDRPEHTDLRKVLLPFFTPDRVQAWEPLIRDVAHDLLNDLDGLETFDVAQTYARKLPSKVFSMIAGFPLSDGDILDEWVSTIFYKRTTDQDAADAAEASTLGWLADLVAERRRGPAEDDLIGKLLAAEIDGTPLTDELVVDYCYLLLLAGLDTTAWAIRSSLWHLARSPRDRQFLSEDTDRITLAIEEFLRCLSPVQAMARTARTDIEYGGQRIPAGTRIALLFGAANRDPEFFEDPNEVRVDRNPNRHIAFGAGIHRCMGSNLARLEMKVAIQEFLGRFPNFELVDGEAPWYGVDELTVKVIQS